MRMRIWGVALLVGATLTLVAGGKGPTTARADESTPPDGAFSTLSYNVAGLPSAISGLEPEIHTPMISPLLNDYDLVLVQESWINPDPPIAGLEVFHEVLVSQVTHPYLSEPAPPPLGTNPVRPSALVSDGLNRMSQFAFGELTRVMWPSCFGGLDTSDGGAGDCLSEKGFSFARTELAPGIEVDVYNLHAEAGNTPADWAARAEGYETLAAFINEHSVGRAVIVGGDYNLHTDRPEHHAPVFAQFLTSTGLTDVCAVVDCGPDDHRIDKFTFRSGGGVTLEPTSHEFEREKFVNPETGAPLSDHPALAVNFAWTWEVGSIGGMVVDGADEPLAGAAAWAYADTDTWVGTAGAVTAADGTYVIDDLPPGSYRVMFRSPPGTGHIMQWWQDSAKRATATHVVVGAGESVGGIDGRLVVGGMVTGVVTGPTGPGAGVQVWAYGDGDIWVGTVATTTAPDGTYTLAGIPAGSYRILFRVVDGSGLANQWWDASPTRAGAAVLAIEGNHVTDVDAALVPASP